MHALGSRWAIVLAAGDGTRLRSLTTDGLGRATPKQYCSLCGGPSLVQEALQRAKALVPAERIVVVVAAEHQRWWTSQLAGVPADNIIVQPKNRGTAPGLLLPLLTVLARDPQARVAVLPSDHFVRDEATLAQAMNRALDVTNTDPRCAVLLGITPDAPESEYGWIVPTAGGQAVRRVAAFVEKPAKPRAEELLAAGGLWNSFLFAVRGTALLQMFGQHLPELVGALRTARLAGNAAIAALYDAIPSADFSREVLQASAERLRLLVVPECGWTDLGTPRRVAECLAQARNALQESPWEPRGDQSGESIVNLAEALALSGAGA